MSFELLPKKIYYSRLIFIIAVALILPALVPTKSMAQTTAAQIQRAEDLTSEEINLRKKLAEDGRVFINKIIVKGAGLISGESIDQIISGFQKHWLTPSDIQQIIEQIKQVYQQSGLAGQLDKIEYQIKGNNLKILIQELAQKINKMEEGSKK